MLAWGLGAPIWAQDSAVSAPGAVVRGLDKVNGHTVDANIPSGGSAELFGLLVTLSECRYPADNPTGDAYAFLTIRDPDSGAVQFEGWMIASSPALSALDHSRYDIWVLRCSNS
ncbi:DUF2155 domain-containing protein [Parasedimentitalea psychrophila]|uniref:DUF2155 domain-containing protein n=1 Tax=Parasedimentitalea psychrophila TaxID=2997337 RepID=A0A9Y2P3H8_9RHOB|nr:DUF2155 domain-containing protein [Parasedimentitalea psychrophila]WIY27676.1 DUF2155 domain-containing protein [Parasedimentitalea psychrophila]